MVEYTWTELDRRARWGDGPWLSEPDKVQWTDPATGYPCLIRRNESMGFLCGYVGVAPGHPFHRRSYNEAPSANDELTFASDCDDGDSAHAICHIPEPGQPEHVWWLGFDFGHYNDYSPGMEKFWKEYGFGETLIRGAYKDVAYAKKACEELAAVLKAQEKRLNPE